jgi:hypothetical protein
VPYNVSVILPDNLSSGYLQSEFINSGQTYTNNSYSKDPNLDNNRNTLIFGFEVRDSASRQIVNPRRIKVLYLSNDKEFDPSTTISINNFPSSSYIFDPDYNYEYTFNPLFFFDNTVTQGTMSAPSAGGSGLFKVYNWPLSANGGLSTVYMKAILEGPNGADIEYPMGYGIFDQILWEGQLPVNPDFPEIVSGKAGYTGKNSLLTFVSGNQVSAQTEKSGIARYLGSVYEISNTGGTYDAYSANSAVKRSLIPSASIASTTLTTYRTYDGNYNAASVTLGASVGLTGFEYGRGIFAYSKTKITPSEDKTDYFTQAGFSFTTSGIAVTSQAYLKFYSAPDTSANGNEIICRIDIPNNSRPISYLYTRQNGTDSTPKQITNLPHSLLPLLQSGGVMEMYYSSLGSTNLCFVEAYYTPNEDQSQESRKSYLLANSLLSSFGSSSVGSAFGYQISQATGSTFTGGIILDELFLAQGKSKLSADFGDCSFDDISITSAPIVDINYSWTDYENEEFIYLTDAQSGLTINKTAYTEYIEISKLDSTSLYTVPATYELQMYKPSLSNRTIFEVSFIHGSDDIYVAFSTVSSYRSHSDNNLAVLWDRPFGCRCEESSIYTDSPLNAPTVLVNFSGDKKEIAVYYRTSDNKLRKQTLRSYQPTSSKVKYSFEITDQVPASFTGRYKQKTNNGTYLVVKEITGSGINIVGVSNLFLPLEQNAAGLGYFSAVGIKESSYSSIANRIYSVRLTGLPNFYKEQYDNDSSVKTFSLSDEGIANNKHYLGQKLLSGSTDFLDFSYASLLNVPKLTLDATYGTGTTLPNSPSYASNVFTAGSATTLVVDGSFVTSSSDYVLVKDQSNPIQNGVYYLSRVGTATTTWRLARVPEMDSSTELFSNSVVRVASGTSNVDTSWYLITPDPMTLGSTGLTFSRTNNISDILSAATTGENIDIDSIGVSTVDGISLADLSLNSQVLIKDQYNTDENGVYKKSVLGWSLQNYDLSVPLRCNGGSVNVNTNWYKADIADGESVVQKFISTTFFSKITIGQISSFVSSIKPHLFEFKMNWKDYQKSFKYDELQVRFFDNLGDIPDYDSPLTDWIAVNYNPYQAGFDYNPNNELVQLKLSDNTWNSSLSQSDEIWVAITLPFSSALGKANGILTEENDFIANGDLSGHRIAKNLWHKLHCRYYEKEINSSNKNAQHFRVRAVSHNDISSFATKNSDLAVVDITPPKDGSNDPTALVATESTLRMVEISIQATDNESGILAFRVGKEIDNSFINYTPWLPWSKFIVASDNKYVMYLYGHLNYYPLGPEHTSFINQTSGYAGQRKVWIQLMDYMGNISESNPLTFVATSQALVDTQSPIGGADFYDPRTNQLANITNLPESWLKMNAYDLVSGIKDFSVRRLLDSGYGEWSEWTPFNPYAAVNLAGETDGVKKVEIKFRDFGNNITQPENKWDVIRRPKV